MSLDKVAEHLAAQGRGTDSMLVHMSPKEVGALQHMAGQHGGSLTINPATGLPEAGFLDQVLPLALGVGATVLTGGAAAPWMVGLAAGAGTYALTGDLNKGLMAGLGAFGGAGLAGGIMEAGMGALASTPETVASALGTDAATGLGASSAPGSQAAMLAEQNAGMGSQGLESVRSAANTATGVTPTSAPSAWDQMQAGFKATKFDTDFLKKNMLPIGAALAPALMGGGNLFGGNPAAQQQTANAGYIRPYTYSQVRNPNYTGAGTPYYVQSMTPKTPIPSGDYGSQLMPMTAAKGGIMSLAEGGDTTTDAPVDSAATPTVPIKKPPTLADYLAATRSATANARSIEVPPMQANNVVVPTMQNQVSVPTMQNQVSVPTMQNQVSVPTMQNQVSVPTMQAQYISPQQQYQAPINPVPQAVTDYNNTLAQRAQKEYVDSPQLAAFSSHFNDPVPAAPAAPLPANADTTTQLFQKYLGRAPDPTGFAANANATPDQITYGIMTSPEYMAANPNAPVPAAPTASAAPVGGLPAAPGMLPTYTYNPATRSYTTAPVRAMPVPMPNLAAQQQLLQDQQRAGYNADQGGGVGVANGGLMSYAAGGGIGSSYTGFDGQNNAIDGNAQFNQGPQYPMQQPQNFAYGGGITNSRQAAVQSYIASAQKTPQGMKDLLAKAQSGDYDAMIAMNTIQDTPNQNYAAGGGIYNLGGYSDGGRLLKGPGDGVSDDIPAQIGAKQPARLADNEFVLPARIVSEIGNGSTDAGAKRLYAMMDRIQKRRSKTTGKGNIAVDSGAHKELNRL
jgi:hypothetical protein